MVPNERAKNHISWEPILYAVTVLFGCLFAWYTLVARVGLNDLQIAEHAKQIQAISNAHEKEVTAMDQLRDAINNLKVELAEQRGVLRHGNLERAER